MMGWDTEEKVCPKILRPNKLGIMMPLKDMSLYYLHDALTTNALIFEFLRGYFREYLEAFKIISI